MNYQLKKMTLDIITDEEYMMYQEIPAFENGAINNLKNTSLTDFYLLVKDRIAEEFQKLDEKNTPRITYIFYVDSIPVGEIMIRPVLNTYWKLHSGNIGYKIRPTKRNMGFGTLMLKYALIECKKMGMKEVSLQTANGNIYSEKVILNNGGKLINSDYVCNHYKIEL